VRPPKAAQDLYKIARRKCAVNLRQHKKRNVSGALPERLRAAVRSAMSQA
jgi:hypothetical protein